MEHRLAQRLSLRSPATEPTKPQRPLSAPLAAIFLCVLRAASHRAPTHTIFRYWISAENAERFHQRTSLQACFASPDPAVQIGAVNQPSSPTPLPCFLCCHAIAGCGVDNCELRLNRWVSHAKLARKAAGERMEQINRVALHVDSLSCHLEKLSPRARSVDLLRKTRATARIGSC